MKRNVGRKKIAQRIAILTLVTLMVCTLAIQASATESSSVNNSAKVISQTVQALPALGELTDLNEELKETKWAYSSFQ